MKANSTYLNDSDRQQSRRGAVKMEYVILAVMIAGSVVAATQLFGDTVIDQLSVASFAMAGQTERAASVDSVDGAEAQAENLWNFDDDGSGGNQGGTDGGSLPPGDGVAPDADDPSRGEQIAQGIFDAAQWAWQNIPGKDRVEGPLTDARDRAVSSTIDFWNSIPGNDFVEGQIDRVADQIPFNNVLGASLRELAGQNAISLDQDAIDLILNDPAWVEYRENQVENLVTQIQNDPRFGNEAFDLSGVTGDPEFGGQRGSFNPLDPSSVDTWRVAGNELTWLLRHADATTTAEVAADGTITLNHRIDDTLDLRPGENRSVAYNITTSIMGTIWHDILGGEEAAITGEWNEVIRPND